MGNNGRDMRDGQDWRSHRDREFEDRDEGNRRGDHPHDDRSMPMQRDRYATGQSGYSSGRSGEDPSLNYQNRNSGYSRGSRDDRQVFGTDDRFTGRAGTRDYAQISDAERIGQRDSYGDRNYDQSFGQSIYDHRGDDRSFRSRDYGPSESERGAWSTNPQRADSRGRYDVRDGRPGEHRGKGPRGYTRSDERIKETVCEALTEDAHIDASGIDVEVRSGEVILSGMVPDRQTKRMAEDLVENLSGVRDVANQLKVSDDERQKLGRAHPSGNQNGNGAVGHEEPRKGDDKKARA